MAFMNTAAKKQTGFAITAGPQSSPANSACEKTVLASIATNVDSIYLQNITEEMFYDARHKTIFYAIEALALKLPGGVTTVTSGQVINLGLNRQQVDEMGGQNYIEDCIDKTHSDAYVKTAVNSIKDCSLQRRFINECEKLKREAHGKPMDELMALFNQMSNSVMKGVGITPPKSAKTVVAGIIQEYRDYQDKRETNGLFTGVAPIDGFLQGIKPCYTVLGALSSTGKTALAVLIFYNLVMQGKKVIFFSQEMTAEELIKRILTIASGIGVGSTNSGVMTATDSKKAEKHLLDIATLIDENAEIYDNSSMTVSDVQAKSMAFQRRHGKIDAILVDYLQALDIDGYSAANEAAKVQEISKKLKGLGKDLGCLMFALSQLTPSGDMSAEPTPFMLRGSRQIMQDADIIILMSRKQSRKDRQDNCDILAVNFAKGRSTGETSVEMKFSPKLMTFSSVNEADYSGQDMFDNCEYVTDNSSKAVKQPTPVIRSAKAEEGGEVTTMQKTIEMVKRVKES